MPVFRMSSTNLRLGHWEDHHLADSLLIEQDSQKYCSPLLKNVLFCAEPMGSRNVCNKEVHMVPLKMGGRPYKLIEAMVPKLCT